MNVPTVGDPPLPSTRPYLIRALHAWCCDNGFTPHLAVQVDEGVRVPMEFVRDGQIVLNIGLEATQGLSLDNEYISFKARFGGSPREILVPVDRVLAIYARENGQGLSFPVVPSAAPVAASVQPQPTLQPGSSAPSPGLRLAPNPTGSASTADGPAPPDDSGPRPTLKRIK